MAENDAKTEQNPELATEAEQAENATSEAVDASAEGGAEEHTDILAVEDEFEVEAPQPPAEETVETLAEQLEQAREQVLRAQAEAQNVRRRAEKDVEHARKYALEKFCSELLPVVDNLERALDASNSENEAVKPLAEGVDLTLKSFLTTLEKFQLVQLDPTGEPFDPQLHQALAMVPNPDMEPNTVMDTMQKGFTLNGRLVRPAMVVVAKAPD